MPETGISSMKPDPAKIAGFDNIPKSAVLIQPPRLSIIALIV